MSFAHCDIIPDFHDIINWLSCYELTLSLIGQLVVLHRAFALLLLTAAHQSQFVSHNW